MREGEIIALGCNDIDFENRILHITKSARYTKDFNAEGEAIVRSMKITIPKTLSSVRDIEYPGTFEDLWKQAKIQNSKNKLEAGSSFDNKYNLAFTNEIGEVLSSGRGLLQSLIYLIGHFMQPGIPL